jgi:hypothetical protein
MVWLPTPLKGFTDAVPEIKRMLRVCAFHLYGWACEHQSVAPESAEISSGAIPDGYPATWPTGARRCHPRGTAPFTSRIRKAIDARKAELKRLLDDAALTNFPREEVAAVLKFWKVEL